MNFYDSIIEGAQELPATDRGQLYVACLEYLYYGREPNFKMKAAPKAMFVMMRPVLDNQRARKSAGSKGGKAQAKAKQKASKAQANSQAKGKQKASEQEQEEYTSTNEHSGGEDFLLGEENYQPEYSSETDLPVSRELPPPTLEEVKSYCEGNGLRKCNPTLFYAYYESQGWVKPNGLRVTNWQALASQWDQQDRNEEASRIVKKRTGRDFSAFSSENWETL